MTLTATALHCVRDGRTLFADLDLCLEAGAALQVEGANGAGKTSLLRILCGLTQPAAGAVYWHGDDIRQCRPDFHRGLLYIGHAPALKDELTPLENLRFLQALHGDERARTTPAAALETVGLYGYEDVPVRSLSAGQRRRAALARLWLSSAPLWVLDEPLTALDHAGARHLETRVSAHVQGGGLAVITSHQTLQLADCRLQRLALSCAG